jgi:ubiquinone biosynthesis monooxygenase Coq7
MSIALSRADRVLAALDGALKTVAGSTHAARPIPRPAAEPIPLTAEERRLSGALMRVNHVGEVCAQAMYEAQALSTRDAALCQHFERAARDEGDHLAWTRARLTELDARPSVLNPLWYAGAFAIGLVAGRFGDRASLGFVVETERQVEQHLARHLDRLPAADTASRALVAQMRDDEARHGDAALAAGGASLPAPVRGLMRMAAAVMTRTAHHI